MSLSVHSHWHTFFASNYALEELAAEQGRGPGVICWWKGIWLFPLSSISCTHHLWEQSAAFLSPQGVQLLVSSLTTFYGQISLHVRGIFSWTCVYLSPEWEQCRRSLTKTHNFVCLVSRCQHFIAPSVDMNQQFRLFKAAGNNFLLR